MCNQGHPKLPCIPGWSGTHNPPASISLLYAGFTGVHHYTQCLRMCFLRITNSPSRISKLLPSRYFYLFILLLYNQFVHIFAEGGFVSGYKTIFKGSPCGILTLCMYVDIQSYINYECLANGRLHIRWYPNQSHHNLHK